MRRWRLTPSSRAGQLLALAALAVLLYVGAATGLSAIPGYDEMRHTLAGVRWPWVLASLVGVAAALRLPGGLARSRRRTWTGKLADSASAPGGRAGRVRRVHRARRQRNRPLRDAGRRDGQARSRRPARRRWMPLSTRHWPRLLRSRHLSASGRPDRSAAARLRLVVGGRPSAGRGRGHSRRHPLPGPVSSSARLRRYLGIGLDSVALLGRLCEDPGSGSSPSPA